MHRESSIDIVGHCDFAGPVILGRLETGEYEGPLVRTGVERGLTHQAGVEAFFDAQQRDYVFLTAVNGDGKPDGTTCKLKLSALEWQARIDLCEGSCRTVDHYIRRAS